MNREDGKMVWDALIEIGIDPVKILGLPMFVSLAKEYAEGRSTKAAFQNGCEVLNVFQGGRLTGKPDYKIPLTGNN